MILYNQTMQNVAIASKFNRGKYLAQSIAWQDECLQWAQESITKGYLDLAKDLLTMWKKERKVYKLALSWQDV